MQSCHFPQLKSIRQHPPTETADCKFCYGSTLNGLPICTDCYRELGAGE
jgi:hypothetical protein